MSQAEEIDWLSPFSAYQPSQPVSCTLRSRTRPSIVEIEFAGVYSKVKFSDALQVRVEDPFKEEQGRVLRCCSTNYVDFLQVFTLNLAKIAPNHFPHFIVLVAARL